jgi:hypothetical protein
MMEQTGGCLCGAVRFSARGEPENVRFCHCRLCQKAMGAPFFARALYPRDAIRLEGDTERFPTSDRLARVFCPKCGTRIMAERTDGSFAGLALTLFDDPDRWTIECHMFTETKLPWLVLGDGLPQYPERAPV